MTEHLTYDPTTSVPRKKKSKQISSSSGNSQPPSLSERIQENPVVHKAVENTSQLYNNAKNYNRFTKWSLELAESPVVYVAGKTQDTFGPTLMAIDQFAGETVDRAGSLYDANRSRVLTPISNVSDKLLTSAERAVDTYLPPLHHTQTGPSTQSQSLYEDRGEDEVDDDEEEVVETKYNRSKKLTRTVYDRLLERVWRLFLYAQSMVLYIIVSALLTGLEIFKGIAKYVFDVVFRFLREPRNTIMRWIENVYKFASSTAQFIMYPSKWLEFVINFVGAVVSQFRRVKRQRRSRRGGERVGHHTKKRKIQESKDEQVPLKYFQEAGQENESVGTKMD